MISTDGPYQPTMSPAEVERRRRWHQDALAAARTEAGADGQHFDYLGLHLFVPPDVQPITGMSHLIGEAVVAETRPGERVLDMGTGCGVNAILAARAGAHVVAVDVNPSAVASARVNCETNGVADRVDVRESDVWSAVRAQDRPFDLMIIDPPFRWFEAATMFERATADPGYRALRAFAAGIDDHLAADGRVLMLFGSSGDLAYAHGLVAAVGLTSTEVARRTLERDGVEIVYVTTRLTRATTGTTA